MANSKVNATVTKTPTGVKIVKKKQAKFIRFHSWRYDRVKPSWRKPRGIDNRCRRKFKGTVLMPSCGYRTAKATRDLLPNGLYKFLVRTPADVEMLLMQNKKFCVEVSRTLGVRKRREIIARADQMGLKVLNRKARLQVEEDE